MLIFKVGLSLSIFAFTVVLANGQSCTQLSESKQQEIKEYVKKRYKLGLQAELNIEDNPTYNTSCFHELKIRVTNPDRFLILHLTPDQRYLTSLLMDLTVDPLIERRKQSYSLEKVLLFDDSPERGSKNAEITIVEFSDFQCPFCSRFVSMFESLPDSQKSKVRLVFKEMPLRACLRSPVTK